MRRRRFLAATAIFLSGCLSNRAGAPGTSNESPGSTETTRTTANTPGTSGDRTGTPGGTPETPYTPVGSTGHFGVSPNRSDCPDHRDCVRVICAGEVDPAETPLLLGADPTEGSLPAATFEFTLSNDTDATFKTNFYDWAVSKRVDGQWYRIAPRIVLQPLMSVDPGGSHTWRLSVDNSQLDGRPLEDPSATEEVDIAGLGGGEYAFTTSGWFGEGNHDRQIGLAARFSLSGDPVELVPTDGVTETVRDGDTFVVHTGDGPGGERFTGFALERTDADPDRTLIAEQAIRDRWLRNTLPYFEDGIDTVRLADPSGGFPASPVRDGDVIGYRGESFRVSAEE